MHNCCKYMNTDALEQSLLMHCCALGCSTWKAIRQPVLKLGSGTFRQIQTIFLSSEKRQSDTLFEGLHFKSIAFFFFLDNETQFLFFSLIVKQGLFSSFYVPFGCINLHTYCRSQSDFEAVGN